MAQQSQLVQQFKQHIYPMIERLNKVKDQSIDPSAVKSKRQITKAVSYLENSVDLVNAAFNTPKSKTTKREGMENGEREWENQERTSSYRRQPQSETL